MTDRDVVDRVATLFARAVVSLPPRADGYKPSFVTTLKGAPAVDLMRALRELMSATRETQIQRALQRSMTKRARRYENPWPTLNRTLCGTSCDVAWLAGLLEGEGTFGINATRYPAISVVMAERTVIERVAKLVGAASVRHVEPRQPHWATTYVTAIVGVAAARWMHELRPLMGRRRGRAIDDALAAYVPVRLTDPPSACVVAGCAAPHRARGLCHKHYMMWARDRASGTPARVIGLR